ncbi:MAG: hypothetical protein KDA73_10505 [Rhodobacteraceae bacterium]|nr:hypothetical protein [Paracoccaceae bacterium]
MTRTADQTDHTETPRSDAQVWNDLREALGNCLRLDAEMSAHAGTAKGDTACEAFDAEVDKALLAYADMTCRGLTGLFEDVLLERGLAGDAEEAAA